LQHQKTKKSLNSVALFKQIPFDRNLMHARIARGLIFHRI